MFAANFAVLAGRVASEQDCGQEELASCSKSLQSLTDTSELSFVTKKSELEKICP